MRAPCARAGAGPCIHTPLCRESKTDYLVLKNLKNGVEGRNSVLHFAALLAHAYMQARARARACVLCSGWLFGVQLMRFARADRRARRRTGSCGTTSTGSAVPPIGAGGVAQAARAVTWGVMRARARFAATASLGAIHKGHLKQSMVLLEPYLPRVRSCCARAPCSCSFGCDGGVVVTLQDGGGSSPYVEGGAL